jgi:hypothetical protein
MKEGEWSWRTVLGWGVVLTLVLGFGAFVGEAFSGTCMFVLMPYFAALAAVMPIVLTGRFGAGIATYLPYAVLGFVPLLMFDWLQSHALKGVWALFVWAGSGLVIGAAADSAWWAGRRLGTGWRAALTGAVVQLATFFVMLLGLTYLYVDPTAADSHLRLFDTHWYFTVPWMTVNGAFGGFTAASFAERSRRAPGREQTESRAPR